MVKVKKFYKLKHYGLKSALILFIFCLLLPVSKTEANPLTVLANELPPVDLPYVGATIAHGVYITATETLPLAIQSQINLDDPSVTQGLASGTATGASGEDELQFRDRSFNDGNDILSIALLMLNDWIDDIIDFYTGESDWAITGLCNKKTYFYPYQEYYTPVMYGEITSDFLRGQFLESLLIRPLFETLIENGPLAPLITTGLEFPEDLYDAHHILASYDINRTRALTEPESDGEQKNILQRAIDYGSTIAQKGNIPDAPGSSDDIQNYENAINQGRGETTQHTRNVEAYRFSGLANLTGIPFAFLGSCHHRYIAESTFPFLHHTGNPLIAPFARSSSHKDMLLAINFKLVKMALAAAPGTCVGYDLLNLRGMPGSLGIWPPEDDKFGTIAHVNPGISGLAILAGANEDNCYRNAGPISSLTNRIPGNKPFKNAFYLRHKTYDVMSNLLAFQQLPSFKVRDKGGDNRYPSRMHLKESSFGSHGPTEITPSLWVDPLTQPFNKAMVRSGTDMDIGYYSEWHGMECCPSGYSVIVGTKPQVKGKERAKDGWY